MKETEKNADAIRILVCFHKPFDMPKDPMYLPVQVGKEVSGFDLGIQGDNGPSGDHISSLNPVYCEMTAMYWAWKQIRALYPDTRYVGLCHYRRYFNANNATVKDRVICALKVVRETGRMLRGTFQKPAIYEPQDNIKKINTGRFRRSDRKLRDIIVSHDIVYTKPVTIISCNVRGFFNIIGKIHIDLLDEIVKEGYAAYYPFYEAVMNGNRIISSNMIIMKTEFLDSYCGFVFGVLEKHLALTKEKGICKDPETEGSYARVSGYLAEILTAVFVMKMKDETNCTAVRKFFVAD